MKEKHNYTYMVLCRDGSLYTGWTTDIDKRIEAHNSGKGAKVYQKPGTGGAAVFRGIRDEGGGHAEGSSL